MNNEIGSSIELVFSTERINISDTIENTIEVQSCTLFELLSGKFGSLVVPEYQRPYIWTPMEIGKLLKDLKLYFDKKTLNQPLYYLGSIILHKKGNQLNIIDGQQRITTFAILQSLLDYKNTPCISYASPQSIDTIQRNYLYLKSNLQKFEETIIDLEAINVTLIITQSEDDAYTFFETQNTGGVKLSGIDIIKAHHLRALTSESRNHYALIWETQKQLKHLTHLLLKARYWGVLNWKKLPHNKDLDALKAEIIQEFREKTIDSTSDIGYQLVTFDKKESTSNIILPAYQYAIRQPLNNGQNFIEYIKSFGEIYHLMFVQTSHLNIQPKFYHFVQKIIQVEDGTVFLKELFEVAMLCYVHRFGINKLDKIAYWLFRYIYSLRLSQQKTVREDSISKFLKNEGRYLLDHILTAFSSNDLLCVLQQFDYTIDEANCEGNTVKKRFINRVVEHFQFPEADLNDKESIKNNFDKLLKQAINDRTK